MSSGNAEAGTSMPPKRFKRAFPACVCKQPEGEQRLSPILVYLDL